MVVARPGSAHIRPVAGPVLAVDAMGGDYAPDEIVAGALAAQREHGIQILLTGPAARLHQALTKAGASPRADELTIVPAEDNLAMDEGALASLRRPRSSVAVACQLVRRGDAAAVVSAGLDRRRGRHRPAAAAVAARRAAAGAGRGAADPARPHGAHRRRGHRRPQAGDARAVRPARRGLRPARARRQRPAGGAAHHRLRARQGQQVHPAGARAAGRRPAARRAAADLRGQRRGRRPAGRRGRRDRDRRLHRERRAEDAGGLDPVRLGRAAGRGDRHRGRPVRRLPAAPRPARDGRPAGLGELRRRRPAGPGRNGGHRPRRQHRPRDHLGLPARRRPGPRRDHREDHPAAQPGPPGQPGPALPAPPVIAPLSR